MFMLFLLDMNKNENFLGGLPKLESSSVIYQERGQFLFNPHKSYNSLFIILLWG